MSLNQAAEFFEKLHLLMTEMPNVENGRVRKLLEELFKTMFNFILALNDQVMNVKDALQELQFTCDELRKMRQ
jgi:hypothetical protein